MINIEYNIDMKIELYPCFQYLKQFNNIWLYSDPHFADEEVNSARINYIGDDEQVKRINAKVGKKDAIIFLGDIGEINYIKKIKGYKILITGNHDSGKSNYERKITAEGDNHLFDEIYTGIVMINDKILLSHEPVNLPFVFNVHGHDHSNYEKQNDENHLNVCAEHIDYSPINLCDLVKSGTLKNIEGIHRIAIDAATAKKIKKST